MSASLTDIRQAALQGARPADSQTRQLLGALVSSVLAVSMAVFGMTGFALVIVGAWWAVSHVPGVHGGNFSG